MEARASELAFDSVKGKALIPSPTLPDSNDRHILVAAIVERCDVIVTKDLRDFPAELKSS